MFSHFDNVDCASKALFVVCQRWWKGNGHKSKPWASRGNRISASWSGTRNFYRFPCVSWLCSFQTTKHIFLSIHSFIHSLIHCLWGAHNVINAKNLTREYLMPLRDGNKRQTKPAWEIPDLLLGPTQTQPPNLKKRESERNFCSFFIQSFPTFPHFSVDYKSNISFDEISCMHTETSTPAYPKILSNKLIHSHDCVTAINSMLLAREPFLCNFLSIHRLSLLKLKLLPALKSINQSACGMHRENNEMRN